MNVHKETKIRAKFRLVIASEFYLTFHRIEWLVPKWK